jgi:hypothetical protein
MVARQDHTDVPQAAAALGVQCVEHGHAMQRTEQIVAKLDAGIASAQRSGSLRHFNIAYRESRRWPKVLSAFSWEPDVGLARHTREGAARLCLREPSYGYTMFHR